MCVYLTMTSSVSETETACDEITDKRKLRQSNREPENSLGTRTF